MSDRLQSRTRCDRLESRPAEQLWGNEQGDRHEAEAGSEALNPPAPPEAAVRRRQRKRPDVGSVRFSERDRWVLAFIGEQYAISVRQLAQLIERGELTGAWLRTRWRDAGWVESRMLTKYGPSMLWLTREGVRVAQSPYRRWRPNVSLATHIEAVTNVRLLLERQLRLGEWCCERELARSLASPKRGCPHLPDGLLETGSEQIAVEVELTPKGRGRLTEIFAEVGENYSQVWYFAAPSLVRILGALAAEAPRQNIIIHPYPPRPGDLFT